MPLRVAVLGAGCIGQWVGGHLASAGVEVALVGRSVLRRTQTAGSLNLTDVERDSEGFRLALDVPSERLQVFFDAEKGLRSDDFDAVFVCLKMHDNQSAAVLRRLRRSTVIVSLQNGVDNQRVLSNLLPEHTVAAGMVPYGVVEIAPGNFRRGTYGSLAFTDAVPADIIAALRRAGLATDIYQNEDMNAVLSFKLVVNLGNALNALVGQPLDACMQHRGYRQLLTATWQEGLDVMKASGTRLQGDINGQPLAKAAKLLRLPNILLTVARYIKGVPSIDPSYHSSMFYDLKELRQTEVNELNQLVVKMGEQVGIRTPVNKLLTRMIYEAQSANVGSPRLSPEQLHQRLSEEVAPGTPALRLRPLTLLVVVVALAAASRVALSKL